MNITAILKAPADGRSDAHPSGTSGWYRRRRFTASGIGLWVFMGVATALFSLFIAAYTMRMDGTDWSPIAIPWQLWLSTALLFAGSAMLQRAKTLAHHTEWKQARLLLMIGGMCAFAFLCVQLWAWQALLTMRIMPAGNPAASFFYLLTAMHGLHVIGGLVGWGWTMQSAGHGAEPVRMPGRIGLCARYWHFLLAVWLVLFATVGWLTPDLVRLICGTT